ncbi:MAG: cytochrome c [Spirochaetia bacterium]|nr:cytochrome c [Spirochaetia bacterium]
MKKILLTILAVAVLLISGLAGYTKIALPNVGAAPEINVERTPERVARGEYLANNVAVCMDCHSSRDWNYFAGPPIPGTLGKGGERFDQMFGFPGVYYSKNITPAGISKWTDGELFRLITTGVKKDGSAIFPVMPFPYYARMDEEDIKSIIAYIRTLPTIENQVAASKSDFPMNFIINTIPKKATPGKKPDPAETVKYGEYLTNAAACMECHTPVNNGQVIPDLAFSGGREFPFPSGDIVRSRNITPDQETGIGDMSRPAFVNLFKQKKAAARKPAEPGLNTMMPWSMYAGMSDRDLGAIYDYLMSVKPISNRVVTFQPHK